MKKCNGVGVFTFCPPSALNTYWVRRNNGRACLCFNRNAIIARNLGFKVSDVEDVIGKDGKPKDGGLAVFDLAERPVLWVLHQELRH